MFERIVVGTDGSETAGEAVRQAAELAAMTNAKLEIVSAYEPVSRAAARGGGEIPGDVAHAIGPREDVNVILEAAAGPPRAWRRGRRAPSRGRPADAILSVAEETRRI